MKQENHDNKTKLFIICPGLGHVYRGFESFAQECFTALSDEATLDVTLIKGGGPTGPGQVNAWNLPRENPMAKRLGTLLGRNGYFMEEITFFLGIIPHMKRHEPNVVFFSDFRVGTLLAHWRRLTKRNFKLLFNNGGPFDPPFPLWDHVQQVTPTYLRQAQETGYPDQRQSLVPHGRNIPVQPPLLSLSDRTALRQKLGLPADRPIVLSVAALNKAFKRIDYLIEEVAALPEPRPYLLILGQAETDTPGLRKLAEDLLGRTNFDMKSVPAEEVPQYYQCADVFVLASLKEGFGLVLVEALSYGLPCLAHDYDISRYVLCDEGYYSDFRQHGSLAQLIIEALKEGYDVTARRRRHQVAYDNFDWKRLRPRYVSMIQNCARQ